MTEVRSRLEGERYATAYHAPVLVEEVLHWLDVKSGKRFIDGTAGGGGHTEAILEASAPDGQVLALDRDPEAVREVRERLKDYGDRLIVVEANYGDAIEVLDQVGWPAVDGWLIDAGVSSHQLDEAQRGFSFQYEGPLDMRMGPEAPTVAEYLDDIDVDELAKVLKKYGEVRRSWPMARKIVDARRDGQLETTQDLAQLVLSATSAKRRRESTIHPATLVFQALRIAVNRELEHLERAVEAVPDVVANDGRAVFISFHSLEDRIIKHGFRRLADPCTCPPDLPRCGCGRVPFGEELTRKPVMADEAEVSANPRSRSAKLRAFRVTNSQYQAATDEDIS